MSQHHPAPPRRVGSLVVRFGAVALAGALALTGCSKGSASSQPAQNSDGTSTLTLWTHNAGNDEELAAVEQVVSDYNASQTKYKVELQAFPQDSYNQSVTAAAAARKLPCILDVDGPNVPNWAGAGYLAPIEGQDATLDKFLPSTVGKYDGKTWSFGHYDVALTMFARKSVLEKNKIRIPTIDKPWTKDEFGAALKTLKSSGGYDTPLDMSTGSTGEWWPYAYSPLLQSFGGDLINRDGYTTAEGVLNGPQAVEWATWFRSLVSDGYMQAKSGADSQADWQNGKSAILYNGSWGAQKARDKFGDDVVFLPPPDLGHGPKIGGGSWQWAASSGCSAPEGAQDYLKFSMQDKYVASIAKAAGTIPATEAAASQVEGYGPGGDNEIFRQYSQKFAVVRPVTPGYPFIATEFTKTAQDIVNGQDPKKALDAAVTAIDANQKSLG